MRVSFSYLYLLTDVESYFTLTLNITYCVESLFIYCENLYSIRSFIYNLLKLILHILLTELESLFYRYPIRTLFYVPG